MRDTLHIRNFDATLLKRMKLAAIQDGLTLREWTINSLKTCLSLNLSIDEFSKKYLGPALKHVSTWDTLDEATKQSLSQPGIAEHNTKTCRVYRCAQCISLGKKF